MVKMVLRIGAPPLMIKHGMANSSEYTAWEGMKQRVGNPNSKHYSYYGGRGIAIDARWNSFEEFYLDMGKRPEGFSLDRIDPNGDYCKSNCRWTDWKTQSINKRKQKRNKSGKIGVDITPTGKYVASIRNNKKKVYLGTFDSLEEASLCRSKAEVKFYGRTLNE